MGSGARDVHLHQLSRDDAAGGHAAAPSSCCGPSRRRRSISKSRAIGPTPIGCARSRGRRSVPILIGSDQIEQGVPPKYFNSAFLVREDGSTGGVYRKMHLVPFGEYVPFKRMLFFAAPLVEAVSDFSEGGPAGRCCRSADHLISTSICYEIVYPNLVRQFVRGRQRAAHDDHERCVVRQDVGAVSAFRAGLDARD